jgi:integrase/recombinase XerD
MATSSWSGSVNGPLAEFESEFRVELLRLGYTAGSARLQVRLLRRLSGWLDVEQIEPWDLDADVLERFFASCRAGGAKRVPTAKSFGPLLSHLREQGVVAVPAPRATVATASDDVVDAYGHYLRHDRGLAARTVSRHVTTARRLLAVCTTSSSDATGLGGVTADSVREFLLGERGRDLAVGTLRLRVDELRSFLRFLHVKGWKANDLTGAVPSVAGWRNTGLPSTLTEAEIAALLASCDRSCLAGLRDFAILLLLARLGLRVAEVAGLELDDLRWRQAEIVVGGKGRRSDRLPLPAEVGEAIVAYLAVRGRITCCRAVFVTCRAPTRPMHPMSIGGVARRACQRAGIEEVGAHRLRHGLASTLLRQGSNLIEIGQLLRQRDLATTAWYAKVDYAALRSLALPWPPETVR